MIDDGESPPLLPNTLILALRKLKQFPFQPVTSPLPKFQTKPEKSDRNETVPQYFIDLSETCQFTTFQYPQMNLEDFVRDGGKKQISSKSRS
jgi:hypothetical protein